MNGPNSKTCQRGIALVTVLLAVVLLLTIIAVLVDIGSSRLRRSTQALHALQALSAADAGAGWVRALLKQESGDITSTLNDLALARSTLALTIDAHTRADILVSIQMPASSAHADHLDSQLQENPQILETPAQVVATASIYTDGSLQAMRTVTTLLRTFRHASPYSEIVGSIDDAGPVSIDSPGDPAGQIGSATATDLRLRAFTETPGGREVPADKFEDDQWFDGNNGSSGILP